MKIEFLLNFSREIKVVNSQTVQRRRALDLARAFSQFCKQIALATADICFDFRYRTVVMPAKKLEQERVHNELLSEGKFEGQ